jgi:hypothetical protein
VLGCGGTPAFVLRFSGTGGLLELGKVGGFRGTSGVAADGGGRRAWRGTAGGGPTTGSVR